MLSVRHLVKEFGGICAVDRCSFEVERGTIVGLIGPNGAGKTTVFNLISGFDRPTSGEVWYDGARIEGLRPYDVARKGLVRTFQIPRALKNMTVLENLMLAPMEQTGVKVWSTWLWSGVIRQEERSLREKALGILDFLELTRLQNELAGNLSVGQKKLLELARSLMTDPRMILLDEPGAGVNPTLMARIVGYVKTLCERGTTFLLIEHDMDLITQMCHRVIVMNQGALLAQGTWAEIRKDPAVLEAYLGA